MKQIFRLLTLKCYSFKKRLKIVKRNKSYNIFKICYNFKNMYYEETITHFRRSSSDVPKKKPCYLLNKAKKNK